MTRRTTRDHDQAVVDARARTKARREQARRDAMPSSFRRAKCFSCVREVLCTAPPGGRCVDGKQCDRNRQENARARLGRVVITTKGA